VATHATIKTVYRWHVRRCGTCGGYWAGWRDGDEPAWAWPVTGTRLFDMTHDGFAAMPLCECDPDRPEQPVSRKPKVSHQKQGGKL